MFMVSQEVTNTPGAYQSFQHNRLQSFAGNNFEHSLPIHHDPTYIQHNSAPGQPMFMASQEMTNPPGAYKSFQHNRLQSFAGNNFEQSLPIHHDPTYIQHNSAPGQPMFMASQEMTNPPGAYQSFQPNNLQPLNFAGNNFEQSLPIHHDPTYIQHNSAPGQPLFMVSQEVTNPPGAYQSFQHNRLQSFAGNNFEQSLPIHHDPTYIQHNSAPGQPMFMASQEMTNPPGAYQSFQPNNLQPFAGNNFEQSLPIHHDPTQHNSAPGQPFFMASQEMTNPPSAYQSFQLNNRQPFAGNYFEQSLPIRHDPTYIQHNSAPGQPMFMASQEMTNPPCAYQSFQPNDLQPFAGNDLEQSLPIHHDPTYIQHNSAHGQPMFMASQEMTDPPGAYQSFQPNSLQPFAGNNF